MDELVKIFGDFIYRDLFYVISGLMIISCGFEINTVNFPHEISENAFFPYFICGIAYVLGILNQEIWSQTPLLKTSNKRTHRPYLMRIFKRHMGHDWEYGSPEDPRTKDIPRYKRALNLKQLGSSMGSGFLTSSIFLFVDAILKYDIKIFYFSFTVGLIGALLVVFSLLHNMRQTDKRLH